MKVLGTGLSGLVGSRVVELLSPRYSFENLSLETGVDITNADDIRLRIEKNSSPWMFHFAAYTNVQRAEIDKGAAWKVNVEATQHIIDACIASHKRLLYIDTDYAFDGKKKEGYGEDDTPNPLGEYAKSKSEGAKRVLAYDHGLVIRISNPYRAHPVGKKDFVHKILERLQTGQSVSAPTDQLFVPTFIDDIAVAVDTLVAKNAFGIYHVVSAPAISPFDAARTIARAYGCDEALVGSTTFAEYFKDRSAIPKYAVLSSAKITALGVSMHDFESGIEEVHRQEAA